MIKVCSNHNKKLVAETILKKLKYAKCISSALFSYILDEPSFFVGAQSSSISATT